MKRRLWIALGVLTAAIAVIAAVLHFRRKSPSPTSSVRVVVAHKGSAEQNDVIAGVLQSALLERGVGKMGLRTESTPRGVTFTIPGDGEPPLDPIRDALNAHWHELPANTAPAVVSVRPDTEALWIVAPTDLSADLQTMPGVVSMDACGKPRPDRLRVTFDWTKVAAYGLELADLPLAPLPSEPEKLRAFAMGPARLSDVAIVTAEKHPPLCAAWSGDARPMVVHVLHPDPKLTPAERAKISDVATQAGGTVLAEHDAALARFVVMGGNTQQSRRRLAADLAGRAKAQGLPIVAALVNVDGVGTLVFKRPVDQVVVKSIVRTALNDGWGGFLDAEHLDVVVRRREQVETRAAEVVSRVSTIDGVGLRLAVGPPVEPTTLYDLEEDLVKKEGLNKGTLQMIIAAWQGDDVDSPIVFDFPSLAELRIHGRPAQTILRPRTVMLRSRRVYRDGVLAIELAWENATPTVLARVRQALGESSDVEARLGAGLEGASDF